MADKSNSTSRQIYLTFPADSSFTDEDVSNYFGNFGPVQDVRIPYQQKQMFGFVTFLHSETVRIILARGNPHFIYESRVLVKPYKKKGRILEAYQYSNLNEAKDVSTVYESCLKSDKIQQACGQDPPLLIQFWMFFEGYVVKGTLLLNKKLPPGTIQIRPSMIKVENDPNLSNFITFNSLEVVSTMYLVFGYFLSLILKLTRSC